MLATNTTPNDRNASQAAGTCTYISRCTSPCSASAGTTNSPPAVVAPSPTSVAHPSRRCALRVPALTSSRSITFIAILLTPSRALQGLQVVDEVRLLSRGEPPAAGQHVVPHTRAA